MRQLDMLQKPGRLDVVGVHQDKLLILGRGAGVALPEELLQGLDRLLELLGLLLLLRLLSVLR